MRLVAIVTFGLAITGVLLAEPQDRPESPSKRTSYDYINCIIDSFSRCYFAVRAVNEKANDKSLVEKLTSLKNANIELHIAQQSLQPFKSSNSENVRQSATAIMEAYEMMARSNLVIVAIYEKLDSAKTIDDLAGIRTRLSDGKVSYQQAVKVLAEASTLALASVVVPDPNEPKNHIALDMTQAQADMLRSKLKDRFGPRLELKPDDDADGSLPAAKVLSDLLKKKWRYARSE